MERRFAILIGINDYADWELDYCVKDIYDVKNIIEKHCKFNPNHIRIIESSNSNPQNDIETLLSKAINSIKTDFAHSHDSFFFYFSGHGKKNTSGTVLKLHSSEKPLQEIIDSIAEKLMPKHEFYVIDSCYSGEKIKSEELENDEAQIITSNKFSLKSESFNILTASRYDQPATENRKYQNGILTHYFIQAIITPQNYNQFGFISPDNISSYVQINVSLEKEFSQIPYSLNKNSGNFPFSFIDSLDAIDKNLDNNEEQESITLYEAPTVHFHYRLVDAFPGTRGILWFHEQVALNGLKRFFEKPVTYKSFSGYGVVGNPIWWFRGNSALPVERFENLEDGKLLLNKWELKIKKVAIFNGTSYWNNVIYVETEPDEPTHLNKLSKVEIKSKFENGHIVREYFGYNEGKIYEPEQAEDGGAIIDGNYIQLKNAEVRQRFLSPFNFILVAKFSPANSNDGNQLGEIFMDDILRGNKTFEDFISEYDRLPRNRYD